MQPEIRIINLENCHTEQDVVVVIDVCRAFTTAAYAFVAGVERILLAATLDEALALKEQFPGSLVMGEVEGKPVPQFDLWNSPAQFAGLDVVGRTIIQRTSAGTQGVVRSTGARHLVAASLVVAAATAAYVRSLKPDKVAFVATGWRANERGEMRGAEDVACAEYIGALLQDQPVDAIRAVSWVDSFRETRLKVKRMDIQRQYEADVKLCAVIDRFSFAMRVDREQGLLVMRPAAGGQASAQ
jgi:2-phosphosulfolactate phosphatase